MNYEPNFSTGSQPQMNPTSDEKTLALLSHVLTFVAPVLAPLIIYLIKKDESGYIAYHAKESLNFQISIAIYAIILCLSIIGILFLWVVGIAAFVLVLLATIKAADGQLYRYPLCIRIVK